MHRDLGQFGRFSSFRTLGGSCPPNGAPEWASPSSAFALRREEQNEGDYARIAARSG